MQSCSVYVWLAAPWLVADRSQPAKLHATLPPLLAATSRGGTPIERRGAIGNELYVYSGSVLRVGPPLFRCPDRGRASRGLAVSSFRAALCYKTKEGTLGTSS
jgi:hypothetical protein